METRLHPKKHDNFLSMVLLMGNTGSGKSHFINKLKEGATVESEGLNSCTSTCQIVQTRIGGTKCFRGTEVAVVDCPGFNDTTMSDAEVLTEIANILSVQYLLENKLKLRGILYLRDITKCRMEGSDVRTLELFSKLVGREAFPYVVFVTTKWGLLGQENSAVAERREMELKEDFWKEMIMDGKGSYVTRFEDTKDSAEGILAQIVGAAKPVTLKIQHELVNKDMKLAATSAGAVLVPIVEDKLGASQARIQRFHGCLEKETNSTIQTSLMLDIQKAEKERDKCQADKARLENEVGTDWKSKIREPGTWQDALRTACSVLSVVLEVVSVSSGCTIM